MAVESRVFLSERMHWTLEATCAGCGYETRAPLHIGGGVHCMGCGALIQIDPARTTFHRSGNADSGHWIEAARLPQA